MRYFSFLILVLSFIFPSNAYKIALFALDVCTGSQILWNARVADALIEAGHNVTLIRLQILTVSKKEDFQLRPELDQWVADCAVGDFDEIDRERTPFIFQDMSLLNPRLLKSVNSMFPIYKLSCEKLIQQKDFMEKLKAAKFDLAFTHMYDFCAIGLIHYAKIPTWIWLNGAQLLDHVADYMGVPSPPGYVPAMLQATTEEMSLIERFKSMFSRFAITYVFERKIADPQTEAFRKHIDPAFPSLIDLAKQCPLVMVNSNEMYNFPRPILHKIIYIGGLGMDAVRAKPLTGEFQRIADKAEILALMTFGSHINSSAMPEQWKMSFMNAFRKFKTITFIVRYTTHDLDNVKPPNVYFSEWIPQTDLLHLEKTRLLITHGGYNSIQEAIHSKTPLIMIPLIGDQPLNAKIAEKHGLGYVIEKGNVNEEEITKAMDAVLTEDRYIASMKKMHDLVRKKPSRPEKLLLEWTEFLAEFKQLDNLVPYGTKLGFIQYFCLDVIAATIFAVLLVLFITCKVFRWLIAFMWYKITKTSQTPTVKKKAKKH